MHIDFRAGLKASGSDQKEESYKPVLVKSYSADISDTTPEASLGAAGCNMTITKAEVDAATPTKLVAGGQILPYAYDTTHGKFYLLIEPTGTKSVQFYRQGFVRTSLNCK